MKTILFGHVCIDRNTIEGNHYKGWGSSLLYIAKYLQKEVSIEPGLIAPYGTDLRTVSDQPILNEPNVDNTLVYENIVENGERRQKVQFADTIPQVHLDTDTVEKLASAELFIFAPLLPDFDSEYLRKVMSVLPDTTLKVILPQGYFRQVQADRSIAQRDFIEAKEVLPLFDMMILSNEDIDTPSTFISTWHSYNQDLTVIVTQNKDGATAYTAHSSLHIPTTPISGKDIVNPIGTGDVFSVACAYHYAGTQNLEQAIKAGHEAAARSLKTPQPIASEAVQV